MFAYPWRRHYPKVFLVLLCLVVWELAVKLLKIEASVYRSGGNAGTFRYLGLDTLYPFLLWTGLALLPVWASACFPLHARPRWRVAIAHLAGLMACLLLFHLLRFWAPHQVLSPLLEAAPLRSIPAVRVMQEAFAVEQGFLSRSLELPLYWAGNVVLNYIYVFAACHLFAYQLAAREKEALASRMAAELSQAQLQTLKSQIQPHFLFNALANIHALIAVDDDGAKHMVTLLSDFLRSSLAEIGLQFAPLSKELAFLDQYLEIQQVRFSNRLKVVRDIHPEALDLAVPHLILQPLVENALKHGIAPHVSPGTLWISAGIEGERLRLEVHDDGAAKAPGRGLSAESTGLGLKNTRERLKQIYGERADLAYGAEDGCWHVRITLPCERLETP